MKEQIDRSDEFEAYYEYACELFESDYSKSDIKRYLAAKGAEKAIIKAILREIKGAENTERRRSGLRLMIGGLSTVAIGILLTVITYSPSSAYMIFPYGMLIVGCATFFKGLVNMF